MPDIRPAGRIVKQITLPKNDMAAAVRFIGTGTMGMLADHYASPLFD